MSYSLDFEPRKNYIYITVTGDNSLETVSNYLSEVREICQHYQIADVLIAENLQGPSLDTLEIFNLVAGRSQETVTMAGRIAYVDLNPEHDQKAMKFAETVAVNRGVSVQIFATVEAAESWLTGQES